MKLRKWQEEASKRFFKTGPNYSLACNVPTGAGKTFFAITVLKILETHFKNLNVLIIAPKKVILEKTWLAELLAFGYTMKDIGIFTGGVKEYARILLTTTASVTKINTRMYDMVIADELHYFGTPRLLNIIKRPFRFKIGLTATINRSDMKHWSIYEAFNYHIYSYSIKSAMDDKVLNEFNFTDYKLKLMPNELKYYKILSDQIAQQLRSIGSYYMFLRLPATHPGKLKAMKLINERKQFLWNYKLKFDIVLHLCRIYAHNSKIVVFSQFNKTTDSLKFYLECERLNVLLVHSNIKDTQRVEMLRMFEHSDTHNIMLATKALDEGWNLPKIDIGIILAGDSTDKQTIQRLGRVLRKKNKKSLLFQLSIKETVEEKNAVKRTEFFKTVCNEYEEIEI